MTPTELQTFLKANPLPYHTLVVLGLVEALPGATIHTLFAKNQDHLVGEIWMLFWEGQYWNEAGPATPHHYEVYLRHQLAHSYGGRGGDFTFEIKEANLALIKPDLEAKAHQMMQFAKEGKERFQAWQTQLQALVDQSRLEKTLPSVKGSNPTFRL